jgi:hypothetical protein
LNVVVSASSAPVSRPASASTPLADRADRSACSNFDEEMPRTTSPNIWTRRR